MASLPNPPSKSVSISISNFPTTSKYAPVIPTFDLPENIPSSNNTPRSPTHKIPLNTRRKDKLDPAPPPPDKTSFKTAFNKIFYLCSSPPSSSPSSLLPLLQLVQRHAVPPQTVPSFIPLCSTTLQTPLHVCVLSSNVPLLPVLLRFGYDPSSNPDKLGNTPMHYSMANSRPMETFRSLLINYSEEGEPLRSTEYILRAVQRTNTKGWNVVMACMYLQDSATLGSLLKLLKGILGEETVEKIVNDRRSGDDGVVSVVNIVEDSNSSELPNQTTNNNDDDDDDDDDDNTITGNSLMHVAGTLSDFESLDILIDHGGSIDSLNDMGMSPAALAVESSTEGEESRALQLLLERGARISNEGDRGRNCLALAIGGDDTTNLNLNAILRECNPNLNEVKCRVGPKQTPIPKFEEASAGCLAAAKGDVNKLEIIFQFVMENETPSDLMDFILDRSSNFQGFNPLHASAWGGGEVAKCVFSMLPLVVEKLNEWEADRALVDAMVEQNEEVKIEKSETTRDEKEEEEDDGDGGADVAFTPDGTLLVARKIPKKYLDRRSEYNTFGEDPAVLRRIEQHVRKQDEFVRSALEKLPTAETLKRRLLESRAGSYNDKTPLHLAAERGNPSAVEALLEAVEDIADDATVNNFIIKVDSGRRNVLHSAAICDSAEVHELVFRAAALAPDAAHAIKEEDLTSSTPIVVAIESCNVKFIESALEHFGSESVAVPKALEKAARCGESEVLQLLLSNFETATVPREGNPNDDDNEGEETNLNRLKHSLILAAAENVKDNFEVLELLFDYFQAMDMDGEFTEVRTQGHSETPLHLAVRKRNFKVVSGLVEMGCEVAAVDKRGNSAWHVLAEGAKEGGDLLDLLLNNAGFVEGAKKALRRKNRRGLTPLHVACTQGASAEVGLFVEKMIRALSKEQVGIDVAVDNAANTTNSVEAAYVTPLHLACRSRNRIATRCLVDNGALLDGDKKHPVLYEVLRGGDLDFLNFFTEELLIDEEGDVKGDLMRDLFFSHDANGENILFHLVDALERSVSGNNMDDNDDDNDDGKDDGKEDGKEDGEDVSDDSEEEDEPFELRNVLAKEMKKEQLFELWQTMLDLVVEGASNSMGSLDFSWRRKLDGRTILHLCVSNKQLEMAKELVGMAEKLGSAKEFVTTMDFKKVTAGALAAKTGQTKLSIYLHNVATKK